MATLSRDPFQGIDKGIVDVKTTSVIVTRRTRAAAVLWQFISDSGQIRSSLAVQGPHAAIFAWIDRVATVAHKEGIDLHCLNLSAFVNLGGLPGTTIFFPNLGSV